MDDPINRFPGGYTENWLATNWERLFKVYLSFAKKIKGAWPDVKDDNEILQPVIRVGGISFTFTSASELNNPTNKHGLLRFIDYCRGCREGRETCDAEKAPLDFVSFKTKTAHAYQAYEIASAIRAYLNQNGYGSVELISTSVEPDYNATSLSTLPSLAYGDLKSAHLGAFQTAARIYFQDVPVDWMIAGRGPRVFSDLEAHTTIASFESLIVESDYFEKDATAKPSYMALFPFRQMKGHQRVKIGDGADSEGMTILASHDPNNDKVLHVIVANSNVSAGMAAITYDLVLEQFAPPQVVEIEYKLATLDRNSYGVGSFHFSETGTLSTGIHSGSLRFVHEMAVPSVHYIQFVQP
jgi:hypothetical protein